MVHTNSNISLCNNLGNTSYWFGMPSVDPKASKEVFRVKKSWSLDKKEN